MIQQASIRGEFSIAVSCDECGHFAVLRFERFPVEIEVTEGHLKLSGKHVLPDGWVGRYVNNSYPPETHFKLLCPECLDRVRHEDRECKTIADMHTLWG